VALPEDFLDHMRANGWRVALGEDDFPDDWRIVEHDG
jgi:hypothetical protein